MYCAQCVTSTHYFFTMIMHSHKVCIHAHKCLCVTALTKVLHRVYTLCTYRLLSSFINSYQLSHPFNLYVDGFFVLLLWFTPFPSVVHAGGLIYDISMFGTLPNENIWVKPDKYAHTHTLIYYYATRQMNGKTIV